MPEKFDIVVVGAGPVGLMLSACVARLGPYRIKHIDNRPEPTSIGRADGIQARTLDVLENIGLKRQIQAFNPGLIYEVAFWGATPDGTNIQRTGTTKSYPDYIDTRHPYSTILHQGHIEGIFLQDLRQRGIEVQRPWTIKECRYDGEEAVYPVYVELQKTDKTAREAIRAKYVVGADGARSTVRELLKIPMIYNEPTMHAWSVIDGVVRTDFPDMQIKCTIRSPRGSCMIIPQGNNRVRIYVQINPEERSKSERLSASASQAKIQHMANEILSPYYVEWESVDWHSAYYIGQGISERYSLHNRIFIAGDACHTHSPKAGQGMNYGFLDAHNLAWKLHLVESGLMRRSLLHTYEQERRQAASRLLEFDAAYVGLFSSQNPSDSTNAEFVRIFKQNSYLTSGYGVEYIPNAMIRVPNEVNTTDSANAHIKSPPSAAAASLKLGGSLPPMDVRRVIDANESSLEQDIPFNGCFRVYIFAGQQSKSQLRALKDLAMHLGKEDSVFNRFQRRHSLDNSGGINLSYKGRHSPCSSLFTFAIIFNAQRASVEISDLPSYFLPYRYQVYSDDAHSTNFLPREQGAAHRKMGFGLSEGGVVIARPDGYVGCLARLAEGRDTARALEEYFEGLVPNASFTTMLTRSML